MPMLDGRMEMGFVYRRNRFYVNAWKEQGDLGIVKQLLKLIII